MDRRGVRRKDLNLHGIIVPGIEPNPPLTTQPPSTHQLACLDVVGKRVAIVRRDANWT